MHSQTLDAHTAHKPKSWLLLPTLSKPARTAIRLILIGAMLVAVGFAAWGKLRAEFDETFHALTVCHTVACERTA